MQYVEVGWKLLDRQNSMKDKIKKTPTLDRAYVVTIGINARICAQTHHVYQFAAC